MEQTADSSASLTNFNFGPLFISLAAFMWTLDFVARDFLVTRLSSPVIVLWEHILIFVIILPFLIRFIPKLIEFNAKEWFAIIFIGVGASALATIFLTSGYGIERGRFAFIVALFQQTQPIIAIGLAGVMLKEKLPPYYYVLSLIAMGGVFLMWFPILTNYTMQLSELINAFSNLTRLGVVAGLFGLGAAFLWGSGTVFGRYLLEHSETKVEYFPLTTFRFTIALIFLIVLNTTIRSVDFTFSTILDTKVILNLLFLAMIPGLLSLFLYYYGLKSTHASVATIFELAFPLSFLVLIPLIKPEASPLPIQLIGALVLILSTTALSFIYNKEDSLEDLDLGKDKPYSLD